MQALADRKAQLDSELAVARRELRQERQRQKDANRRVWKLTGWLNDVVVILYDLAGHVATPAQMYLAKAARSRNWPAKTEDELKSIVEDAFLAVDMERCAGLVDFASPTNVTALRVAVKFHEEWRLAEWVRRLNCVQGVAPSTERVLARYEEGRGRLPDAVRPGFVGAAAATKARVWALRWRRRWGARHGAIRAREDIPVQEMRDKVSQFCKIGWQVLVGFVGPDFGTSCSPPGASPLNPVQ